MIATQSSSEMSSPIAVSLTETFASSRCSWMRSSMREILVARRARFALVGHALAEQVERGGDALRVERADGVERLVERLAGDEAATRSASRAGCCERSGRTRGWFER